jgi:hypothetical protein
MKEFLDIYRFLAQKQSEYFEEEWKEEDTDKIIDLLKPIGSLLENGDLIINAITGGINYNEGNFYNFSLDHIIAGLIEIENRIDENADKEIKEIVDTIVEVADKLEEKTLEQQQYAKHASEPMEEINKEIQQTTMPFPHSDILKRYGNATIYLPVYHDLCEKLSTKFTHKKVMGLVCECYKEKADRELTEKTLHTYATRYLQYMTLKGKIKINKKAGIYVKVPEKQLVRRGNIGILDKSDIIFKQGSVNVYKKIFDYIWEHLENKFTRENIMDLLIEFYKEKLNFQHIELLSTRTYATTYLKYMKTADPPIITEGIYEGVEDKKEICYTKIPEEQNKITIEPAPYKDEIKKPEYTDDFKAELKNDKLSERKEITLADGETLSEAIYNYAMRTGWENAANIPVLTIERRFPTFTSDEIKTALAKLIQEGKADQAQGSKTDDDGKLIILKDRIKFRVVEDG